jgi:hypothetical protein
VGAKSRSRAGAASLRVGRPGTRRPARSKKTSAAAQPCRAASASSSAQGNVARRRRRCSCSLWNVCLIERMWSGQRVSCGGRGRLASRRRGRRRPPGSPRGRAAGLRAPRVAEHRQVRPGRNIAARPGWHHSARLGGDHVAHRLGREAAGQPGRDKLGRDRLGAWLFAGVMVSLQCRDGCSRTGTGTRLERLRAPTGRRGRRGPSPRPRRGPEVSPRSPCAEGAVRPVSWGCRSIPLRITVEQS